MRHIISILIENEAGALSRVAGLFSARGYNIESLTVAPTEDPSLSRMTILTWGSDEVLEQITKQLNKLVRFERIVLLVVIRRKGREQGRPHRTHLAAPVEIADRVLQDALEEHRELVIRTVAVFLGQLEHGILDDIERGFLVMHCEHGLLEGPAFDGFQKAGKLLG